MKMMTILNSLYLNKFFDVSWKVLLVIFFIVVIVFILFGLIGMLIRYILKVQSKAVDKDMAYLVTSRVCDNSKDFKKYAHIKSMDRFFKASLYPFIFFLITLILYLVYHLVFKEHPWLESIYDRETGIASLFYIFDFSNVTYVPPLGFDFDKLIIIEPSPFTDERIFNYFIFFFLVIGLVWYLINVMAYIARNYRISKMSKKIYSADLDKMDLSSFYNKNIVDTTSNDEKEDKTKEDID